ncbi:outer membrane protein assembly factor BamB family protein [Natronorubrum sp. DTA7]|uniref:outer membrane protein assembly factor BamB family protein n=1 Tax=Natronorubrum sp. DTA7 TaxID=3447016 RepID=UPI003F8378A9
MTAEFGRRRLLAVAGAGLAVGLGGCGYQAAAGDLDWTESADRYGRASVTWSSDGRYLFGVFDDSTRPFTPSSGTVHVYDSSGQPIWAGSPDSSRNGELAIADGAVFLALEDGTVVRLERDGDETARTRFGSRAEGAETAWSTEWTDVGEIDGVESDAGYENERADDGDDNRRENRTDGNENDGTTDVSDGDERERATRLDLHAITDLVVGTYTRGVVAFDASDGEELFHLEFGDDGFATGAGGEPQTTSAVDTAVGYDMAWIVLADGDDDVTLYGVDGDGSVRTDLALPDTPDWLESTERDGESVALVAVDGELRAIDPDGEPTFTVPLESGWSTYRPAIWDSTDRLYYATGGSLTAIDLEAGDRAWHRDDVEFKTAPVANAAGVYGHGTLEDDGDCDLFGIRADGDDWWQVPRLEEIDCPDGLYAVEDRLVAVDGATLYGFRSEPESRYSIR